MEREFIKNILEVETKPFEGINIYKVYSLYNVPIEINGDVYYKLKQVKIEEVEFTWQEIEKEYGYYDALVKDIKETYNIK